MKKLLIISILFLPFALFAQLEVKAYKTRDQYNKEVIRMEIKNITDNTIVVLNGLHFNEFDFNGTTVYFLNSEEKAQKKEPEITSLFPFYPDWFEANPGKLRKVFIKKGETRYCDYPIRKDEIVSKEKKIYLIADIDYIYPGGPCKGCCREHVEMEVAL